MHPVRIFLLRHGQGEHNVAGNDYIPDAILTRTGEEQASSWAHHADPNKILKDVELVLISPLRRALQTAFLALENYDKARLVVCRHARELWFHEPVNTFSNEQELLLLCSKYKRGREIAELPRERSYSTAKLSGTGSFAEALATRHDTPSCEQQSVPSLVRELRSRPEQVICVVCHQGVIHALTGGWAYNCDLLECEWNADEKKTGPPLLRVLQAHSAPGGARTS
ncbi:unnamed protein product [Amoebophrya sp. A120]|nr:unnamed protein product [Amoebophrya sp. A120]|eukprot:GSA120T00020713001.1